MAELMSFNQNTCDPPKFSRDWRGDLQIESVFQMEDLESNLCKMEMRAFIHKNMNPDAANLKKRKLFTEVAEDMGLPAPKHKCFEAAVDAEHDLSKSLVTDDVHTCVDSCPCVINVRDAQLESTQDSNSFPGDTQSANDEVKLDEGFGTAESYDEASTHWDNSGWGGSRNCSMYVESSENDVREEEQHLNQDTGWHDIDGLEECISEPYSQDMSAQTTEGLHEFLSSSEVDPNIFGLASDGWCSEPETQPEKRKPTIDQEFEQYFSTLML